MPKLRLLIEIDPECPIFAGRSVSAASVHSHMTGQGSWTETVQVVEIGYDPLARIAELEQEASALRRETVTIERLQRLLDEATLKLGALRAAGAIQEGLHLIQKYGKDHPETQGVKDTLLKIAKLVTPPDGMTAAEIVTASAEKSCQSK